MHQHKTAVSPHLTPQEQQLRPNTLRHRKSAQNLQTLNTVERERDSFGVGTDMGKQDTEMQYLNFPTRKPTASRYRHILATFLLILCIPIAIYQLVPRFTHATDTVVDSIVEHIRGPDLCTSDVGGKQCCALFLDAAPCVDECRKTHVDRETWVLAKEYDDCSDTCLSKYNLECGSEAGKVD